MSTQILILKRYAVHDIQDLCPTKDYQEPLLPATRGRVNKRTRQSRAQPTDTAGILEFQQNKTPVSIRNGLIRP